MLLAEFVAAEKRLSRDLALALAWAIAIGFCLLVAAGFLTTAAYLAAAAAFGPVVASLCVGGFFAISAAALAFAATRPSKSRKEKEAELTDTEAVARLVDAFFTGFRMGRGDGK